MQCKQQYDNFNRNMSQDLTIPGADVLDITEEKLPPFWLILTVSVLVVSVFRLLAYLVLRCFRNPNRDGILSAVKSKD